MWCGAWVAARVLWVDSLIPQSFIQDLLNRVDIVDVVARYVQLKKGGANFMGLCPFHNEKSPSFTVSPTKQFFHCFGCGAHGTAIGFLIEYSSLSFPEAVRELAQSVGMAVPEDDSGVSPAARVEKVAESVRLGDVLSQATNFYRTQLRAAQRAIDYLKGRGLTGEIAARFGLGYAPAGWTNLDAVFPDYQAEELVNSGLLIDRQEPGQAHKRYDRFRDRIMFPIRNTKGQVIGFGGRVLDDGEPKYLNSPETPLFQKGHELYGLFEARSAIREAGFVIVVEGYMDVVALAQLGVPNAVATLGTACTGTHVQKLTRQSDHVVFSFDGDAAGRRAAWRALEASLPYVSDDKLFHFLFLPSEHDPDSFIRAFGKDAFDAEIAKALPLSAFLLREVSAEKDLATAEGRAHALHSAKPLLQALPAGALRGQIVREVARVTRSNVEEVFSLAGIADSAPARRETARVARHAPTPLEEQVMRLLLAHPSLVHGLDPDLHASLADHPNPALRRLLGVCDESPPGTVLAGISERLLGDPDRELFEQMIGKVMGGLEAEHDVALIDLTAASLRLLERRTKDELDQLAQIMAGGDEKARSRYRDLSAQLLHLRARLSVRDDPAGVANT